MILQVYQFQEPPGTQDNQVTILVSPQQIQEKERAAGAAAVGEKKTSA